MRPRIFILFVTAALTWRSQTAAITLPEGLGEMPEYGLIVGFIDSLTRLIEEPSGEEKEIRLQRLFDDGVCFTAGKPELLLSDMGELDFEVNSSQGEYLVSWSDNGKVALAIKIPANVQVLTLSDKPTLEKNLCTRLRNAEPCTDRNRPYAMADALKKQAGSKLRVDDRGFLIHPDIASRLIYEPVGNNKFRLLYNPSDHPLETIGNMLISGYSEQPVSVVLTMPDGLSGSARIELPLASLHKIFESDGCIPYWAVTASSGETVSGLYLWEQPNGRYIHMITLKADTSIPAEGGVVYGTLTPYIRTDNLKNLFGEFEEK